MPSSYRVGDRSTWCICLHLHPPASAPAAAISAFTGRNISHHQPDSSSPDTEDTESSMPPPRRIPKKQKLGNTCICLHFPPPPSSPSPPSAIYAFTGHVISPNHPHFFSPEGTALVKTSLSGPPTPPLTPIMAAPMPPAQLHGPSAPSLAPSSMPSMPILSGFDITAEASATPLPSPPLPS